MYTLPEEQPGERAVEGYQDQSGPPPSPSEGYPDAIAGVDPFALWAATSGQPMASPPVPETSTRRPGGRRAKSEPRPDHRPVQQERRRLVKLLAVGTVGIMTAVTVGGISFARAPQQMKQPPSRVGDDGSISTIPLKKEDDDRDGDGAGRKYGDDDDDDDKRSHKKPTMSKSPTPRPSPSPTRNPRPSPTSPTSPPTMTPAPTGTVIGSSTQATNTAVAFTNPADGQASWLVHMSNGNFVAVEQACTHAGVAVKYNASTGQFNCPAHGAIFNADGTNPQLPATRPLPPVHITVNANGTITTP